MKIERKELEKIIKKALYGTRKSLVRIESCIRIRVENGILTVYSINDRFSVKLWVEIDTKESFDCIIDAQMFFNLLIKMTGDAVSFDLLSEKAIRIKCGSIKLDFPTLDAKLWPKPHALANVGDKVIVDVNDEFIDAARGCMHALKSEKFGDNLMASINLSAKNGKELTFTALDGYRIAIRQAYPVQQDINININGEILTKALSLIDDSEGTKLTSDGNYFIIESDNAQIIGSLEKRDYYNMESMVRIPDFPIKVMIDRKELLDAVEIASMINYSVDIQVYCDHILISSESEISTKTVIEIPATVSGKDLNICLNGKYLIESLKSISDDMVYVYFLDKNKPIYILSDTYKEIILPIFKR